MDFDPEIPYKIEEEVSKEEIKEVKELKLEDSDVDMKETPEKNISVKEEPKNIVVDSPPPIKEDSFDIDDMYTPIKSLSPMNSDWIIKARISKLYPVKEWSNAKGSGSLLNFELVDRYGTQITATIFNKAVEKFKDVLTENNVYVFCKGTVKVANTKFTTIKNDYSLTFTPYSDITSVADDKSIDKVVFNFSTLKETKAKGEGKSLDLVGVVLSISEICEINLKTGGTKSKRDYIVADNSEDGGLKVMVTLWGKSAEVDNIQPGEVIAFKGLRVTNFKGLTLNGGDYTSVNNAVEMKLKQAGELLTWYRTVKENVNSIQSLTETQDNGNKSSVRLLKEMNANAREDLSNDPGLKYYINAKVETIRNDSKMVYMACPSCKKKMQEEDESTNLYRCERCSLSSTNPVATYMINVKLTDATDFAWIRVHGESALPIMGGITAEKFKTDYLSLSDDLREIEMREILNSLNFKEFNVLIRPSISEYNGNENLNFFASKAFNFSCKKNNDFLIERLNAYQRKETAEA